MYIFLHRELFLKGKFPRESINMSAEFVCVRNMVNKEKVARVCLYEPYSFFVIYNMYLVSKDFQFF